MNGREKQQQLQASGMNNPKKKAALPSTLTLAKRINNTVIKSLQHTYACANPNWESCIFLMWFASDCAWHRRTHNSAKPKVDQKRGGQTRNLHCDNRMIEEASSRQPQQWQIMHCCKLQLYPLWGFASHIWPTTSEPDACLACTSYDWGDRQKRPAAHTTYPFRRLPWQSGAAHAMRRRHSKHHNWLAMAPHHGHGHRSQPECRARGGAVVPQGQA